MLNRILATLGLSAAILAAACGDAAAPAALSPGAYAFTLALDKAGCLHQIGLTGTAVGVEGGSVTVTAPAGEGVTRVAIGAGGTCWYTPEGAVGTYTFSVDGAACYVVDGLGAAIVTVTSVGHGASCQDISHVEYVTAPVTGFVQLCVVLTGQNPPPGSLTFPFPFEIAGQSVAVAQGGCAAPMELSAGEVVIREAPNSFSIFLWTAATAPADRLVGFDVNAQTTTITVVAGSTTVVTITNVVGEPDPGLDGF